MDAMTILSLSVAKLAGLYRSRSLSPVEVVNASLARIEALNDRYNAFVLVDGPGAIRQAEAAEALFASDGEPPPLAGIPVSVKDNIFTAGMRSTSGSLLFRDHVPDEDSGVVAAARQAGAIVVGKTNTPAFGWAGFTDNMIFGPTRNPWNPELTPGGSSGGAAVSVATGMVPLAIGTDGGGSLRTPAAFTGTVGFKPSHGRLPDTPLHPHWLLQHYGPIARNVGDVAYFLDAAAGPHPDDPHSLPAYDGSFVDDCRQDLVPRAVFTTQLGWVDTVDPEVAEACRSVVSELSASGWQVEEKDDLGWTDPAPFATVLSIVGFSHRLRDYRHRKDEIEPGILAMLENADRLPPNAFYDAYLARNAWCSQPLRLFQSTELLITPTLAAPPFAIGTTAPEAIGGKPVPPSAWNPYLRAFNLTGQPAISVPIGFTRAGLPIGLHIVGGRHRDGQVLAAAAQVQKLRPAKAWSADA